jgi:hypothetical protein
MKAAAMAEVIARVEAAGAEPSPEAAGEASQTDGSASGEGSASADVQTPAGGAPAPAESSPSPEATNVPDEAELRAKLERDREKREAKAALRRAKQAEQEREELARKLKERDEREAARKAKPWIERVKEDGEDPRAAFEAMKEEALKAGTPEAQIAKMTQAFEAKLATLETQLKAEREAREQERQSAQQAIAEQTFNEQFQRAVGMQDFAPLLEEYEPNDLYPMVRAMRDNPEVLFANAERLGVDLGIDLTDPESTFNMGHIFTVLRAQQAAHEAKKQRLRKSAEPPQSQPAQPAEAKKPTVNGAEARKAGTTIGNDLASSSAGAPPDYSGETHKQRLKRIIDQFG